MAKSMSPSEIPHGINVVTLRGDVHFMPHHFLNRQIELFHDRLLRFGYRCVVFSEVDEIIMPSPSKYPGGLREYMSKFLDNSRNIAARNAYGLQLGHNPTVEKKINWDENLFAQRSIFLPWKMYNKPVITTRPLKYVPGFHSGTLPPILKQKTEFDPNLILWHLSNVDYEFCMNRMKGKNQNSKDMYKSEKDARFGSHFTSAITNQSCPYASGGFKMQPLGDEWKKSQI